MNRYLVLVFTAIALVIAAPAAFAGKVIFDPTPGPSGTSATTDCTVSTTVGGTTLDNYTPCLVGLTNTPYTVAWVDCSTLGGLNPPATGWCLFMDNVTGGTLTQFTFQFTIPDVTAASDNTLQCTWQVVVATNNCQQGATLTNGQSLDITFFAAIPNNHNFYLITDFTNPPDPASVTVVPEPGVLGMFGLGLLMLGVGYGWQRRRRQS